MLRGPDSKQRMTFCGIPIDESVKSRLRRAFNRSRSSTAFSKNYLPNLRQSFERNVCVVGSDAEIAQTLARLVGRWLTKKRRWRDEKQVPIAIDADVARFQ